MSMSKRYTVGERDEVQGARRAETGVYVSIHEDFEHRATQQFTRVGTVWRLLSGQYNGAT